MTIAIMQPTYIPWMGYFDLIDRVDSFVFLDTVFGTRQSWQVRNRIKTASGANYLSLSVNFSNGKLNTKLRDIGLLKQEFVLRKHFRSIQMNYAKAPFYEEILSFLKPIYNSQYSNLCHINTSIIKLISRKLGLETRFINSSDLYLFRVLEISIW